ncbi:unnamed protein product [Vitrella brassicaformis CCMP3155]|uniref:Phosphoribulokinase/uridine kinase domain-containing protein n=2 Tax=Vitrella brassicaformis TaxID=1169539 RepID=A0A0G4FG08_VITBC|nr:unnamed protein product [Vitrella brassicaformis CCMP3155]|eukprot:CEM11788.1 unnamed protein product [Vitrella brassicaformis CCMP3155]
MGHQSPEIRGTPFPGKMDAAFGWLMEDHDTAPKPYAYRRLTRSRSSTIDTVAEPLNTYSSTAVRSYIEEGPLFHLVAPTVGSLTDELPQWMDRGKLLSDDLGYEWSALSTAQAARIFHYYLPVYFWIHSFCKRKREAGGLQMTAAPAAPAPSGGDVGTAGRPMKGEGALLVGFSAPQGCGKTTLVTFLKTLFEQEGLTCTVVSIDDFYLTGEEQEQLARAYPDNPLLRYRGNAGSHDLPLGRDTLMRLQSAKKGTSVAVPRYDKSLREGRGDRAPQGQWPTVEGPVDVVLCEGWMFGFPPLSDDDPALDGDPNLQLVNRLLRGYEQWDELMDAWIAIQIGDPKWVYDWRLEQEQAMKSSGKPGMTDQQVGDFVDRFMPAYRAYLPHVYSNGWKADRPVLRVQIDKSRSPIPLADTPTPQLLKQYFNKEV